MVFPHRYRAHYGIEGEDEADNEIDRGSVSGIPDLLKQSYQDMGYFVCLDKIKNKCA